MTAALPARAGRRTAPVRVGFCGLLGTGNLGNDGSLQAMLGLLRAELPDAQFDCLCSGPDEVRSRFGLPATRLNWYRGEYRTATGAAIAGKLLGKLVDPVRVWAWVRRHDAVVVPGMGVLEGSLPVRPWGWPYSLLLVCLAGRLTGTPVALVCVGADELARPLSRRLIVWAARLAHHRSFRDAASRDALRAMGLARAAGDDVVTDLAFALPVPPVQAVRPGAVGVGVMALPAAPAGPVTDPGGDPAGGHRDYPERIAGFVGWLLDHGHEVRLLTGDREDEAVAEAVRTTLLTRRGAATATRLTAGTPGSLTELMELMRPLEVVVATRYHNIVCALALGKPTVSIGYAAKNDVLMAGHGLADACQRTDTLDLPRLVEQFRAVRARRDLPRSAGDCAPVAALRREAAVIASLVGASPVPAATDSASTLSGSTNSGPTGSGSTVRGSTVGVPTGPAGAGDRRRRGRAGTRRAGRQARVRG